MLIVKAKKGYECYICKKSIEEGTKCIRFQRFRHWAAHLCPRCAIKKIYHLIDQLDVPKLKVELWK